MVLVYVKTVGASRKKELRVLSNITVTDLKKEVATATGLSLDNLKLVSDGKSLVVDNNEGAWNKPAGVREGGTIIAMAAPRGPPQHVSSRDGELVDDNEDLRFKMPDHASCLERRLATYLRDTLRVPDPALVVFFWLRLRTWACILGWCLLAPIVQLRWELGPVYVIGTCFAIIFFNLGKKQEGDESAYSIFNEGFRELPGTLNADRIDRDIRAGQF